MDTVTLPPELERFATEAVAAGRYRDLSDVVAAGVSLLQRQEQARAELLASVLAAGERLAEHPLLGRRRPGLLPEPYRFWSIPRWRLLLVYDPTSKPGDH